jgi:hypothetical protein
MKQPVVVGFWGNTQNGALAVATGMKTSAEFNI